MDSTSIELSGSIISEVRQGDDQVSIRFAPAILIKTMTGSVERTQWKQNLEIEFADAELIEGSNASLPATCIGGDIGENIYTYRDMVPIPLESRGRAHCDLKLENGSARILIRGSGVRLVTEGRPEYLQHIKPG